MISYERMFLRRGHLIRLQHFNGYFFKLVHQPAADCITPVLRL